MMDSGLMVQKMVEEFISKPVQGHIIVENGKMVNVLVLAHTNGKMVAFIKVTFLKTYCKAKENLLGFRGIITKVN